MLVYYAYELVKWIQQTMRVKHPFNLKTNFVTQLYYQVEK